MSASPVRTKSLASFAGRDCRWSIFYEIWKRDPLLLQFDALLALPEYVKRLAEC
jgi:hypothetical protein